MGARQEEIHQCTMEMAARIERLPFSGYQFSLLAVIATAWLFDSIDLGAMTFLLGPIKAEFRLTAQMAGYLSSASFVGMFFGASIAGLFSDRFGRTSVFQVSMVVWGVGSLLCGLTHDLAGLFCARVITGFGMGMEFPVAQSLASEITPKTYRGKAVAILEGFWPIGFIVAGCLSYVLLPSVGWRGVFIVQALPALFLLVVRSTLPESPRWLASAGRATEARSVMDEIERRVRKASARELPEPPPLSIEAPEATSRFSFLQLWSKGYRLRTIVLWLLWFFALLGYYGLTTWLSTLLQARGFTVSKSILYTVMISLAGIPGFALAALLIDVVGRKLVCFVTLIGGAAFAYLYGTSEVGPSMIAFGCMMQFCLFGMWSVLYAYTPELYPTRARATGTGFASAVGRLGSLLGPTIAGIVLPIFGQTGVFSLGAGALVCAAIVVGLGGVETKGRLIEEVSA